MQLPKRSLRSRLISKAAAALAASSGKAGSESDPSSQADEFYLSPQALNQLIEPPSAPPPPLFFFPTFSTSEKNGSNGNLNHHGDSDEDEDLADYTYVDWLENAGNKKKRKVPSAASHASSVTGVATTYAGSNLPDGNAQGSQISTGGIYGTKSRMSLIVLRDRELARRKKLETAASVLKVIRAKAEEQEIASNTALTRKKRIPVGKQLTHTSRYKLPSTDFIFECKSSISDRLIAMREEIAMMSAQAGYGYDHYMNNYGAQKRGVSKNVGVGNNELVNGHSTPSSSNQDDSHAHHYPHRPPPPPRRPAPRRKPRTRDEDDWMCIFCEYEMIFGVKSLLARRANMLEEKKTKAATKAKVNAAKNRRSVARKAKPVTPNVTPGSPSAALEAEYDNTADYGSTAPPPLPIPPPPLPSPPSLRSR